jgi:hypothetical protein
VYGIRTFVKNQRDLATQEGQRAADDTYRRGGTPDEVAAAWRNAYSAVLDTPDYREAVEEYEKLPPDPPSPYLLSLGSRPPRGLATS